MPHAHDGDLLDDSEKIGMLFKTSLGFPTTSETMRWYTETDVKFGNYSFGTDILIKDISGGWDPSGVIRNSTGDLSPLGLVGADFASGGGIQDSVDGLVRKYTGLILNPINNNPAAWNKQGFLENILQFNYKSAKTTTNTTISPYNYTMYTEKSWDENIRRVINMGGNSGNAILDIKSGVLFIPDLNHMPVADRFSTSNKPVLIFYSYIGKKGLASMTLNDLSDVSLNSVPNQDDVLKWDNVTNKWGPVASSGSIINKKKQTFYDLMTQQPQKFTADTSYNTNGTAGISGDFWTHLDFHWTYDDIITISNGKLNTLSRGSGNGIKDRMLPYINEIKIDISGVRKSGSNIDNAKWQELDPSWVVLTTPYPFIHDDDTNYVNDISVIKLDRIALDLSYNVTMPFDIRIYGLNGQDDVTDLSKARALIWNDICFNIADIPRVKDISSSSLFDPSYAAIYADISFTLTDGSINRVTVDISQVQTIAITKRITDATGAVFSRPVIGGAKQLDPANFSINSSGTIDISIVNLNAGSKYDISAAVGGNLYDPSGLSLYGPSAEFITPAPPSLDYRQPQPNFEIDGSMSIMSRSMNDISFGMGWYNNYLYINKAIPDVSFGGTGTPGLFEITDPSSQNLDGVGTRYLMPKDSNTRTESKTEINVFTEINDNTPRILIMNYEWSEKEITLFQFPRGDQMKLSGQTADNYKNRFQPFDKLEENSLDNGPFTRDQYPSDISKSGFRFDASLNYKQYTYNDISFVFRTDNTDNRSDETDNSNNTTGDIKAHEITIEYKPTYKTNTRVDISYINPVFIDYLPAPEYDISATLTVKDVSYCFGIPSVHIMDLSINIDLSNINSVNCFIPGTGKIFDVSKNTVQYTLTDDISYIIVNPQDISYSGKYDMSYNARKIKYEIPELYSNTNTVSDLSLNASIYTLFEPTGTIIDITTTDPSINGVSINGVNANGHWYDISFMTHDPDISSIYTDISNYNIYEISGNTSLKHIENNIRDISVSHYTNHDISLADHSILFINNQFQPQSNKLRYPVPSDWDWVPTSSTGIMGDVSMSGVSINSFMYKWIAFRITTDTDNNYHILDMSFNPDDYEFEDRRYIPIDKAIKEVIPNIDDISGNTDIIGFISAKVTSGTDPHQKTHVAVANLYEHDLGGRNIWYSPNRIFNGNKYSELAPSTSTSTSTKLGCIVDDTSQNHWGPVVPPTYTSYKLDDIYVFIGMKTVLF